VDAAIVRITGIDRARYLVVAIQRSTWAACPTGTEISNSADTAIFAGHSIVHVSAAAIGLAAVISAEVLIVTVHRLPTNTIPRQARLPRGASVTVVTGQQVVSIEAALSLDAGIVGARVVVVTIERCSRFALAGLTPIIHGAHVAVIATCIVGQELTTRGRLT